MNLFRKFNPNQLFVDGALGQYFLGLNTGFINVGVTGEMFQFRWSDPVRICAIQRLSISVVSSVVSAADVIQVDVVKATSWTVAGTGATAIDMTAGTNKRRTGMDTSKIPAGDIRCSGTPLGVGTKTLEANSLSSILASGTASPNLSYTRVMEYRPGDSEYPLVLQANEGFVIKVVQNAATQGNAIAINVDWLETNPS
jgi:hypothetical protein